MSLGGGKNRIASIDMAKGIGILLVVALHTFGGIVIKFALSFAMPMFFMLSSAVARYSSTWQEYRKNVAKSAKKLLIPPVVFYLIMALPKKRKLYYIIPTLIFERCEYIYIGSYQLRPIGILWFFSALFSARIIFDFIKLITNKKSLPIVSVVVTLIGVLMGHYEFWWPLNFDIGLAMQFFMYLGYVLGGCLKDMDTAPFYRVIDIIKKAITTHPIITALISSIFFMILFVITCILSNDYLNIPKGIYPLFPLCFATAILGSSSTLLWCRQFQNIKFIKNPLSYIGSYSMYMYGLHTIDNMYDFLWHFTDYVAVHFVMRIVINIILTFILSKSIEVITSYISSHRSKVK